jgi:GTPase SAR1 family protein
MSNNKGKKKKLVKKFNICVLGPSYVGKSQLVNRISNNSFTGYYEPTVQKQVYRMAYNLKEDEPDEPPKFFDIDIWDLFPHDHPNLDLEVELMTDEAKEMEN